MTVHLKLSVPDDVFERLEKARRRFGKRTAQAVVGEVVADYLYLWEAAEEKRSRYVQKQRQRKIKELEAEAAAAEEQSTPSQQDS